MHGGDGLRWGRRRPHEGRLLPRLEMREQRSESNEDLHTSLQTKDEEVRALRTQLGLAKAEATELRMRRSLPSTETIRIAPVPPIPEEGWQPSEAADDAALPVLRLYGQGDEGTTVEIDDPKSITEGSVDPVTRYRRGLHSLKERDFDKALKSFDTFARLHPTHVYADNALYWSVEIYYLRHDNKRALRLLKQLLDQYPSGNKVPDTLLQNG